MGHFKRNLIHTCTVQRSTPTTSPSGELIDAWSTVATSVRCRLIGFDHNGLLGSHRLAVFTAVDSSFEAGFVRSSAHLLFRSSSGEEPHPIGALPDPRSVPHAARARP